MYGKKIHHETVGCRTREMNCLHLLRKPDGGAGKTRDAHAQYAQASELRYEPAHELPRAGAQIKSAQATMRAQELHDGAKQG